jgi:hypothetical protein
MPYIMLAECPNCGKKANGNEEIEKKFGWRINGTKKIPQSYCRDCRKP